MARTNTAGDTVITNQEIFAKLQSLENMLLERRHLDTTICELKDQVQGNGKPGLNQRMSIQEDREAKRDRREWLVQSLLIAQLIGVVALAVFK